MKQVFINLLIYLFTLIAIVFTVSIGSVGSIGSELVAQQIDRREYSQTDQREDSQIDRREDSQVDRQEDSQIDRREYSQTDRREDSQIDRREYSQVDRQEYSQTDQREYSQVDRQEYSQTDQREYSQVDRQEYSQTDRREDSQIDRKQVEEKGFDDEGIRSYKVEVVGGGENVLKITFVVYPGALLFGVDTNRRGYLILEKGKRQVELKRGIYRVEVSRGSKYIGETEWRLEGLRVPKEGMTGTLVLDLDTLLFSKGKKKGKGTEKYLDAVNVKQKYFAPEEGRNILTQKEMKYAPGSGGDPLKALKNLPGIVGTGSAFFEGLYVRGGNQEDVLYTVDDILIGSPYHAIGIYSVFSAELIEVLDFYPSAYPYTFGNAQGAAVNISSKSGSVSSFSGKMDVNVGVASFYFEVPLVENVLSFTTSFRRSYYEVYLAIAKTIPDVAAVLDFPAPFFFNNYNKLHWQMNEEQSLELMVAAKYDVFDVASPFPFEDADGQEQDVVIENSFKNYWNASGITYRYSTDLLTNKLIFSQLLERNKVFLFGSTFSETDERVWNVTDKMQYQMMDWLKVQLGVSLLYEEETGQNRTFEVDDVLTFERESENARSDYDSIQNNIRFFARGSLRSLENYNRVLVSGYGGVAMEWQQWKVYPGFFSTYHAANKRIFMDPRLGILYQFTEKISGFVRVGQYTQNPGFLVQVPMEFPKENSPNIKNPTTTHAVIGTEIDGDLFYVKTEVYYQYGLNQILLNPDYDGSRSFSFEDNPYTVSTGRTRGYGAEVLCKQRLWRDVFGWLTYTFSVAERYEYERGTSTLRWFYYTQDVTHQVNGVLSYQISKRWRIGGRLNVSTGKPRTESLLVFTDENQNQVIDPGELSYREDSVRQNEARNPLTVRFDFRMDYTIDFLWKSKMTFYLDIWDLEYFVYRNISSYDTSRDYLNEKASNDYQAADFKNGPIVVPTNRLQKNSLIPPLLPLIGIEISF